MAMIRYCFPVIPAFFLMLVLSAASGGQGVEYEIVDSELLKQDSAEPEAGENPETEAEAEENTAAGNDADTEAEQAVSEEMDAGFAALQARDYELAYAIFGRLARQGSSAAQYELGELYHQGAGADADLARALHWYTRAAEQDHADAQYRLGNMYLMGEGVPQSDSEALHWHEKAAQQGHAEARHNLASFRHLRDAKSQEEMEQEALEAGARENATAPATPSTETTAPTVAAGDTGREKGFFKRLLGGGDTPETGGGLPYESDDPEDEMPTPEPETPSAGDETGLLAVVTDTADEHASATPKSARKGFFSRIFRRGDGEKAPPPETGEQAHSARDETGGDGTAPEQTSLSPLEQAGAVSQYELGLAYALGDNVEQDSEKAYRYFAQSAQQGYAPSQYRLGMAYAEGEGVEKDLPRAIEWYEKAALQGHTIARRSLGLLYMSDTGAEQNRPLALAWYSLLAENGNQMDAHRRDLLLRELSEEEIQTAERLKAEIQNRLGADEKAGQLTDAVSLAAPR